MTMNDLGAERFKSPSKQQSKLALVTGASSGFGLLTSLALARNGYYVIATMRDLTKQSKLMEAAVQQGVRNNLLCMQLDITDMDKSEQIVTFIKVNYGRMDVLVNNAGYAVGGFVEDIPLINWQEQMDTNFFGLVAMTRAVLPIMREQGSGTIINVSSVSGRMGFPGYAPYAASKFAVEGFSEALRLEMMPFGVNVVLVEPGSYRTDIWQKGFETIHAPANSAYRAKLEAVLRYSKQSAAGAPNPQEVAELIVRIAGLKKPKLRYPIGKGASLLILGKNLLPWRALERIIDRLLNK